MRRWRAGVKGLREVRGYVLGPWVARVFGWSLPAGCVNGGCCLGEGLDGTGNIWGGDVMGRWEAQGKVGDNNVDQIIWK